MEENSFLAKINKQLILLPKVLNISISLFYYVFHTNRSKYINQVFNIPLSQLGLWYCIPQAFSFFFGIKVGETVDKLGIQKYVLSGSIVASTIIFIIMMKMTNSFIAFLSFYTIYFILVSITQPLVDKITLDYLSKTPGVSKANYGTQRIFIPLTFVIMSFYIEHIIIKQPDKTNDFSKLISYALFAGVIALVTVLLLVPDLPKLDITPHSFASIYILLSNYEYLFFLLIILCNGIVRAVLTNFLSVHWDKVMKFKEVSSESRNAVWPLRAILNNKIGSLLFAGNAVEILVFFISPYIINTFGLLWPLLLAHMFQLIRMIGYLYVDPNQEKAFYYVFGLELFKGANFGLIQCSAATLVNSMCPQSLRSTSQLVFSGTYVGLSSTLSGLVFYNFLLDGDFSSFKMVFLISAIIITLSTALFIFKYGYKDGSLSSIEKFQHRIKEIQKFQSERFENAFLDTPKLSNLHVMREKGL